MLYCTSMYAVHEYQTSKAAVIIESNFWGDYDAYLFPFILSHPLLLCPTFFKTRSLALLAGECCKFCSHAVGPSETWPLNILSAFYRALLCLMGELRQSLFNKSTT